MRKIKKFDNGLTLVYVPVSHLRSATIGVWVNTGSSKENEKNNGISHFIEHMLFKGTNTKTAFEIADYFDRVGAHANAFTSKECTCYYTKCIDEHTEKCFSILSEMYFDSLFANEEAKREKGVVLEEISMTEDSPEDVCLELLAKELYKGSTLGFTILGTPDTVNSFTRDDILDYMQKRYTADNTVIVVCGNVDENEALEYTVKYFKERFKNNVSEKLEAPKHDVFKSCISKHKDIEQANFALAFKSFPYNSRENSAAAVLSGAIGGCMSSRLFQEVREKLGLCYSVYSYISSYKNNGSFNIFTATNPSNAQQASHAIKKEIDKLKSKGITPSEFERAREQIKSSLIMSQESTSAVMNAYGKMMCLTGEAFDIDKKIDDIKSLNLHEVNALIPKIFDYGEMCTSYVGRDADCKIFDIFN